jgi:hypothetical protein
LQHCCVALLFILLIRWFAELYWCLLLGETELLQVSPNMHLVALIRNNVMYAATSKQNMSRDVKLKQWTVFDELSGYQSLPPDEVKQIYPSSCTATTIYLVFT